MGERGAIGPMQTFFRDAQDFLPILWQGCVVTIELTLCALVLSTLLGFAWALLRLSPVRVLCWTAIALITVIRGIPILVQLFYIYFVLHDLDVQLSAFRDWNKRHSAESQGCQTLLSAPR